ncbi:cationic amino acid transporter 3, mitochondrial-like isoform X2 [Ananas comosus]|uniref:Cationic amino acid transporter 3, mitochondrial-like isoform X1 n=1 Tax=Ananas comosus TaxID=4615 RepID=A0A6P5G9Z1_ANACO|nr:cationic amino acid transporter 3, mitochondrial-like isoform X1 [Ananas comosus]XP_020104633.1 cationic amino acid transporter 3, mitochondrial-like isoform X2 [Ananas comosus]
MAEMEPQRSCNKASFSGSGLGFHYVTRRKQVDSNRRRGGRGEHQLARELSIPHLIAIGVGATIGAGVYVLVGTVAREHSGPALTISFLIAGIAAALSALCYAELASRCPSAGSAYHYTYICIGEGVAWLIGWALVLEYTIGGSAVARGVSPNLALFFGGPDSLPSFLARVHIPGLGIVVDPCAAILVLMVTGLLCLGIKESSFIQATVTTANVIVMLFVIIAGGYLGFQTGWIGYTVSKGYFPYGVNGMLAGSATLFFAYIGFDAVASTAEEVKNPQVDLPWGIGLGLSMCCFLYMLVSVVIVGLVPYFAMDPDTPISTAFTQNGMQWAVYVVSTGAILALCSSLIGSILPQPRILMAMARDGLLPPLFADVNRNTQVPVKSTLLTGISAAALAFFMDVAELANMVSVGTLLAFTAVAISILILRYVPPDEVPIPSSLRESIESASLHSSSGDKNEGYSGNLVGTNNQNSQDGMACNNDAETACDPLIVKEKFTDDMNEKERRKKAARSIAIVCFGVLALTSSASSASLPFYLQYIAWSVGGLLLLCGTAVLYWIDQDKGRHDFGHTGGFLCPFVPLLPIFCILINVYLLVNLGVGTWIRVSVWLMIGVVIYLLYGRTHSSLTDVIYVPTAHADHIYRSSPKRVA